ncbi:hypothetical protein, partial [Bacteroides thetaiotaomicron]|uniref:hypothetical protein n=1 Tax=Bacteroides thetaiotaomicron TaxID=818 RepID=UPI00356151A0
NSCTAFSNISSLFSIFEVSTYSVHYNLSAKSGRYSSTVTAKIAITVLSLVAVTALFLHYKRVMLCFVTVTAKHIFIFL